MNREPNRTYFFVTQTLSTRAIGVCPHIPQARLSRLHPFWLARLTPCDRFVSKSKKQMWRRCDGKWISKSGSDGDPKDERGCANYCCTQQHTSLTCCNSQQGNPSHEQRHRHNDGCFLPHRFSSPITVAAVALRQVGLDGPQLLGAPQFKCRGVRRKTAMGAKECAAGRAEPAVLAPPRVLRRLGMRHLFRCAGSKLKRQRA
jgi:hypothetical protein